MKTISLKFRSQITFLLTVSFVLFSFSNTFAQGQTTPNSAVVDFDGDGRTDIGHFLNGATNEETGFWTISSATGVTNFSHWGARCSGAAGSGDFPVAGYNNR